MKASRLWRVLSRHWWLCGVILALFVTRLFISTCTYRKPLFCSPPAVLRESPIFPVKVSPNSSIYCWRVSSVHCAMLPATVCTVLTYVHAHIHPCIYQYTHTHICRYSPSLVGWCGGTFEQHNCYNSGNWSNCGRVCGY